MEEITVCTMPGVKFQHVRRLSVQCPVCGKRVCDISPGSRMEAFAEDDASKPPWGADVFVKCTRCKSEISLYKLDT